MIPYNSMGHDEGLYTFIDEHTGKNVNIASGRLRDWCLEHRDSLEVFDVPVESSLVERFTRDNAVNPHRVNDILAYLRHEEVEPIIFAHDGGYTGGRPDVLLVDGRHRYTAYFIMGIDYIPGWILSEKQWRPFEVSAPERTPEELRSATTVQPHHRSS